MVIYVAGPLTHGDIAENRERAIDAAQTLFEMGHSPIVPHTMTWEWHLRHPNPYESWLRLDFALIRRCDALVRLPGYSPGAEREVRFAQEDLRIPVYHGVSKVPSYD